MFQSNHALRPQYRLRRKRCNRKTISKTRSAPPMVSILKRRPLAVMMTTFWRRRPFRLGCKAPGFWSGALIRKWLIVVLPPFGWARRAHCPGASVDARYLFRWNGFWIFERQRRGRVGARALLLCCLNIHLSFSVTAWASNGAQAGLPIFAKAGARSPYPVNRRS